MFSPWMLAGWLSTAVAGDDPWIAPPQTTNVYVASVGERFANFVGTDLTPKAVQSPIYNVGGKVYVRHGLGSNMDFSIDAPFSRAWASGGTSSGLYQPTMGVGLLQAELRRRWLGQDAPLSASTRLAVRSGVLHQSPRGRLTNLGEGTTDVGVGVGVGRLSIAGRSFVTLDAGATYWYRSALEDDVPADEVTWSSNLTFSTSSKFGFGFASSGLHRLGGQDLGAVSVVDADNQWAALNAQQIKVGGRLSLYSSERFPSMSLSVLRAVWARNNPIDTTVVEIGMGWDIRRNN